MSMNVADRMSVLAKVSMLLDHEGVTVNIERGFRDVTMPLDEFRRVEHDGSMAVTISVPSGTLDSAPPSDS